MPEEVEQWTLGLRFPWWSHDLNYLLAKVPTHREWAMSARWLAFAIRKFGQPTVIEALRQVRTHDISAGYFYGVCRSVKREAAIVETPKP